MSKTTKQVQANPLRTLPEDLTVAMEAAYDALARRKTLDDAVAALPAQIQEAEQEAARLGQEVAAAEAELALSTDADNRGIEKTIETLTKALTTKETELRRARARLIALEQKAPDLDQSIVQAGTALNMETNMFTSQLKAEISAEFREALAPALVVLQKARAVGFGQFQDFFQGAYLPDPETYMHYASQSGHPATGNMLDATRAVDPDHPIAVLLKPAKDVTDAIKEHRPYVPLARRPKPYKISSSHEGPGGRPVHGPTYTYR